MAVIIKRHNKLTTKKTKSKSAGISLAPFLIIAGILGLAFTVYITYRASISDRKLFSASLVALFAGLLFESIRVSGNWKTVLGIFVGTYLFSLLAFLPGKSESIYNFEDHVEFWPYCFIFIFTLFFGIVYKNKLIVKLTEGMTLMLSISLIYWAVTFSLFDN